MSGINLSQSLEPEGSSSNKIKIIDRGTYLSLGLLVVVFLVFGGAKLYNNSIKNKIEVTENNIKEESNKIKQDDVERISDFYTRIGKVNEFVESSDNIKGTLDKVERMIMQRAYIESLSYNVANNSVSLKIVSNDIEDMARQIVSLKEKDYIKEVSMFQGYGKSEDGKVSYDLEITLQ